MKCCIIYLINVHHVKLISNFFLKQYDDKAKDLEVIKNAAKPLNMTYHFGICIFYFS